MHLWWFFHVIHFKCADSFFVVVTEVQICIFNPAYFHTDLLEMNAAAQDKVDANKTEIIINNNWENWQNYAPKIGGFITTWLNSTFVKIQWFKVQLMKTHVFNKLDKRTSISSIFYNVTATISRKIHYNIWIFNLRNFASS